MNAVSTEFPLFEDKPAFAGAAQAAAATRVAELTGRTAQATALAEHADAMSALLHHIHPGASGPGSSLLTELRGLDSETPVVVLLLSEKRDIPIAAVGLKAMELFHKPWFRHVASGAQLPLPQLTAFQPAPKERAATPVVAASMPKGEKASPHDLGLTERQVQVLALIAQGKPNKLICRELRLAEGTVKCHVSAILRALGVHTRTQAALKASCVGLWGDKRLAEASPR